MSEFAKILSTVGGALSAQSTGGSPGLQAFLANLAQRSETDEQRRSRSQEQLRGAVFRRAEQRRSIDATKEAAGLERKSREDIAKANLAGQKEMSGASITSSEKMGDANIKSREKMGGASIKSQEDLAGRAITSREKLSRDSIAAQEKVSARTDASNRWAVEFRTDAAKLAALETRAAALELQRERLASVEREGQKGRDLQIKISDARMDIERQRVALDKKGQEFNQIHKKDQLDQRKIEAGNAKEAQDNAEAGRNARQNKQLDAEERRYERELLKEEKEKSKVFDHGAKQVHQRLFSPNVTEEQRQAFFSTIYNAGLPGIQIPGAKGGTLDLTPDWEYAAEAVPLISQWLEFGGGSLRSVEQTIGEAQTMAASQATIAPSVAFTDAAGYASVLRTGQSAETRLNGLNEQIKGLEGTMTQLNSEAAMPLSDFYTNTVAVLDQFKNNSEALEALIGGSLAPYFTPDAKLGSNTLSTIAKFQSFGEGLPVAIRQKAASELPKWDGTDAGGFPGAFTSPEGIPIFNREAENKLLEQPGFTTTAEKWSNKAAALAGVSDAEAAKYLTPEEQELRAGLRSRTATGQPGHTLTELMRQRGIWSRANPEVDGPRQDYEGDRLIEGVSKFDPKDRQDAIVRGRHREAQSNSLLSYAANFALQTGVPLAKTAEEAQEAIAAVGFEVDPKTNPSLTGEKRGPDPAKAGEVEQFVSRYYSSEVGIEKMAVAIAGSLLGGHDLEEGLDLDEMLSQVKAMQGPLLRKVGLDNNEDVKRKLGDAIDREVGLGSTREMSHYALDTPMAEDLVNYVDRTPELITQSNKVGVSAFDLARPEVQKRVEENDKLAILGSRVPSNLDEKGWAAESRKVIKRLSGPRPAFNPDWAEGQVSTPAEKGDEFTDVATYGDVNHLFMNVPNYKALVAYGSGTNSRISDQLKYGASNVATRSGGSWKYEGRVKPEYSQLHTYVTGSKSLLGQYWREGGREKTTPGWFTGWTGNDPETTQYLNQLSSVDAMRGVVLNAETLPDATPGMLKILQGTQAKLRAMTLPEIERSIRQNNKTGEAATGFNYSDIGLEAASFEDRNPPTDIDVLSDAFDVEDSLAQIAEARNRAESLPDNLTLYDEDPSDDKVVWTTFNAAKRAALTKQLDTSEATLRATKDAIDNPRRHAVRRQFAGLFEHNTLTKTPKALSKFLVDNLERLSGLDTSVGDLKESSYRNQAENIARATSFRQAIRQTIELVASAGSSGRTAGEGASIAQSAGAGGAPLSALQTVLRLDGMALLPRLDSLVLEIQERVTAGEWEWNTLPGPIRGALSEAEFKGFEADLKAGGRKGQDASYSLAFGLMMARENSLADGRRDGR